ncbi:MAG: CehA/McbA family metallohydrolase [Lachnospiraceae bacterium]|nr:CehA/McbA family metallohydrolase [Lachnospiraceae bacterium]
MSVSKLTSMITGMEGAKLSRDDERYTYPYLGKVLKELDAATGYTEKGGRAEIPKPTNIENYKRVGRLHENPVYDRPTGKIAVSVYEDAEPLIAEVKLLPMGEAKDISDYKYDNDLTDFFRRYSEENGLMELTLPEGRYLLVVSKGSEYGIVNKVVTVKAGEETKEEIKLKRFINLSAKGWYVGDLHHHSVYSSPLYPPQGTDYVYDTPKIVQMSMQAAGLTFGALSDHHNVLNHREWEKLKTDNFLPILSKEISTTNGHVLQLNVDKDVIYKIPAEEERTDEYLRNEFLRITKEIKDNGGFPQINHPRDMQKAISFNPDYTDIIDIFDTIEIWNGSHPMWDGTTNYKAFELWLSLLEEGRFIGATTGSDTHEVSLEFWQDSFGYIVGLRNAVREQFSSFAGELKEKAEYVLSILDSQFPLIEKWEKVNLTSGCVRTYVYAPGENGDHFAKRSPEHLLTNIKEGHSFVTNGPILIASINDKIMGETASFPVDAEQIKAELKIISNRPLKTLEVWQNGGRKETIALPEVECEDGAYDYSGCYTFSAADAKWVFFRVYDDYTTQAITNPIFLEAI